jgi:predicted TIM-barrel fold metal-dependent hydrolase
VLVNGSATQVNWFQLKEAARFLRDHPDVTVVVDHMGCLKLGAFWLF